MTVALFADVHGNLPALEAFLAAATPVADAFLCLGDLVNYGPWGDECVELVSSLPAVQIVQGNHDRLFVNPEGLGDQAPLVQAFYAAARPHFRRVDLLADLPVTTTLGSFTCVHTIDGRRVFPDTPLVPDRNFAIGHTHWQFEVRRAGYRIVNPGSVGQNRQRIDRVAYALYDEERESVTFHEVPYDFPNFLSELRARGWPQECIGYYEGKWRQARDGQPKP